MNHVLKHSVQWRPQQLPALIAKISAVVYAQHIEADLTLCGHGEIMLAPSHAKHRHDCRPMEGNECRTETESIGRLLQACNLCMQHLDGRHADSRVNARHGQKTTPAQTQACRKTNTVTVKKRPCVDSLDSDDDFD